MFHIWWPATAVLTFLVMLVILIILMYGDRICVRVKNRTETIMTRMPTRQHQQQHPQQLQQQYREPPSSHMRPPRPPPQQRQHQYDYPPEELEQYEEREVGGVEMQPQYHKKTFSREVEV